MNAPRLLDAYCCAGGAARGYQRAGFHVTGVDINPQPRYAGDVFVQGDAIEYLAEHGHEYDAIHASPPCQDHSITRHHSKRDHGTDHLLLVTRAVLKEIGKPWVIENVPGAKMRADYSLCGCVFGLPGLRRRRLFETSWRGYEMSQPCTHADATITVAGNPGGSSTRDGTSGFGSKADWERAMGIDWMTAKELAQAIPPAFAEHIGRHLMDVLEAERAA